MRATPTGTVTGSGTISFDTIGKQGASIYASGITAAHNSQVTAYTLLAEL